MGTSTGIRVRAVLIAVGVTVAAATCGAQELRQPKVINAQSSVKAGSLQAEISGVQAPAWIGFEIATAHRIRQGWDDNVLHLEGEKPGDQQVRVISPDASIPASMVLLRVTAGRVTKVRLDETDREIDGGGLPFVWLTNVNPAESVKVLKGIVEATAAESSKLEPANKNDREGRDAERDSRRLQDGALVAIALQSAPESTTALRSFTTSSYPPDLRERAAFWLANERGSEGFAAVSELLRTETDPKLREKLVFDLTLVKGESRTAAVDKLLELAKSDASLEIRGKAQFWLAQSIVKTPDGSASIDPRIMSTLGEQAADDPNAAIRKSAVFALSRLPDGQGVPKLIQVASTSKDMATRHEAIFWLGQSKDPLALAYLEKLVKE